MKKVIFFTGKFWLTYNLLNAASLPAELVAAIILALFHGNAMSYFQGLQGTLIYAFIFGGILQTVIAFYLTKTNISYSLTAIESETLISPTRGKAK